MYKVNLFTVLLAITIVLHGFRFPDAKKLRLNNNSVSDISGLVWSDDNRNGLQDEDETIIKGVTAILDGIDIFGDPVQLTTETNASGKYDFSNLVAGNYSISFDLTTAKSLDQPELCQFTIPNVEGDTDDLFDSDTDLSGTIPSFKLASDLEHLDAGIFKDRDGDFIPDALDDRPSDFDPSGWFYCSNGASPGDILAGGQIEVDGPADVLMLANGNAGFYQFLVTKSGTYTINVTPPGGIRSNPYCLAEAGTYSHPGGNPHIGQPVIGNKLHDATCNANPYYLKLALEPGDIISNNNLPLDCVCTDDELDLNLNEAFPFATQSKTPNGVTPSNTNGSEPIIVNGTQVGGTVFNLPEGICETNLQYSLIIEDLECLGQEEDISIEIAASNGSHLETPALSDAGEGKFTFLVNSLTADPVLNPYKVTIKLMDNDLLLYREHFEIVVREPGADGGVSCQKNVSLTVDNNCEARLDPRDILNSSGCYVTEDYYVQVVYPGFGRSINKVTDTGKFNFVVSKVVGEPDWNEHGLSTGDDQPDIEFCEGTVWSVDNTPPVVCIASVAGLKRTQVSDSPKYDHYGNQVGTEEPFYIYEPFSLDAALCENDGVALHLTAGSLADADCNLFACSDLDDIYNVEASWKDTSYVYYTGIASATDNCSSTKLASVYDVLEEGGCHYVRDDHGDILVVGGHPVTDLIKRTFVFEDGAGNEGSATQLIYFTRPTLLLPDCEITLDVCEYGVSTEVEPQLIESFPHYRNGLGERLPIDEHACHLTAAKEDLVFDLANDCGFKISRTWTIKDWCNNDFQDWTMLALEPNALGTCPLPTLGNGNTNKIIYEQNVYLKDSNTPTVKVPAEAQAFSIGPFNCEASFEVPAPIVKGECAYIWTTEIWKEDNKVFLGVETGEKDTILFPNATIMEDVNSHLFETNRVIVASLPRGQFFFKYRVEDKCGNVGFSELIPFKIVDDVAPIAKCDDDLTISIAQGLTNGLDQYGFTRVHAEDVDESSADNCSSEVYREVRRFVPIEHVEEYINGTEDFLLEDLIADQDPFSAVTGYWTPWHPYADFTCADVNQTVTISLQVWDDGDGDGIYREVGEDNSNSCMMRVLVQDKLAPTCFAPRDLSLFCDETPVDVNLPEGLVKWNELASGQQQELANWFEDLEKKNSTSAFFTDNCNAEIIMSEAIFDVKCGYGEIRRYFEVVDQFGNISQNECYQTITLKRRHDYCIRFPKDEQVACKTALDTTILDITTTSCDLLAVSINDERFDVNNGNEGCFKVLRTYRVINWCQFDVDLEEGESVFAEDFELQPFVISRDEDGDGLPGDEDVYVHFNGEEDHKGIFTGITYVDANCVFDDYIPEENSGYWRKEAYINGFYQYTQILKVKDEIAPEITFGEPDAFPSYDNPIAGSESLFKCFGDAALTVEVMEECSPEDVRVANITLYADEYYGLSPVRLMINGTLTAEAKDFNFHIEEDDPIGEFIRTYALTGTFPVGEHEIIIQVSDGCGNTDSATIPFEIYDAKAPALICFPALTLSLSAVDIDGDNLPDQGYAALSVWAEDFVKELGVEEDCSGPVSFSIHRSADIDRGDEIAHPGATSLVLNCQDRKFLHAYVYAWDAAGNGDRCEVAVVVEDPGQLCEGAIAAGNVASINGIITTENDNPVFGVQMDLNGDSDLAYSTKEDGLFHFLNLFAGFNYTVQPKKDDDISNGVSTFDLITITKHILGVGELESPYKMIAADVNNSSSITTLDLIRIRKIVLGVESSFTNNTSWRFVDAAYVFPDPGNPWKEAFPEKMDFNNLPSGQLNSSFVGIKIGDVSGDVKANDLAVNPRTISGTFNLVTDHKVLKAGEVTDIPFNSNDLNAIEGMQFTLRLDPNVQLVRTGYGLLKEENFGFRFVEDGLITVSWDQLATREAAKEETFLFSLHLRANRDLSIKEALSITSRVTTAEAYPLSVNQEGELMDVDLLFIDESAAATGYYLNQNTPNPFSEETKIRFRLPTAQSATLRVFDGAGRNLYERKDHFQSGINEITIEYGELSQSGVLYYTLETPNFTATRKMVVMK